MKPVIALVGRPNVGKSTLFNRLTKTRNALVADRPGLTRDRIYGTAAQGDREFIVIDTAGLGEESDAFHTLMTQQSMQAIDEADAVLFLVDGRDGMNAADEAIAEQLRGRGKACFLAVNKTEGLNSETACAEFYKFGLGEAFAISAAHGTGVHKLLDAALASIPSRDIEQEENIHGIKIAMVGRPNVGKSTLVNRILGEERVLVFDQPGTTRDSVFVPFERDGQAYTLIDTAGVRRRQRVTDVVEKFSVAKTLQAIDAAHVVVLVIDAHEGVSDQDATLSGLILESGRALVIALNKWDGLQADARTRIKNEIDRRLQFLNFARVHYISALHGSGVGNLFPSIIRAYESAVRKVPTPRLNKILETALVKHPPPLVRGRRIKLRYAHQGGQNPPVFVIHGNQTTEVPRAYQRYLANVFREQLQLEGTPVSIEFRTGENPFKGRKNKLTPRQMTKRKRLKSFVKRKG